MFNELDALSNALQTLSKSDAKRILDAVNRRMIKYLDCNMIRVYWRSEGRDGIHLQPITFSRNATRSHSPNRPEPKTFLLKDEPDGVLSWVFHTGKALWLEKLRNSDLSSPIIDRNTNKEIPPSQFVFIDYPELDGLIIVPLRFESQMKGVYAVDTHPILPFTEGRFGLIERLAGPVSKMLWTSDAFETNMAQTANYISNFLDQITDYNFGDDVPPVTYKTGFIARSFRTKFSPVERTVRNELKAMGIRALHFIPSGRTMPIIEDIKDQIRYSHFGIADITGSSPNVLAEIGMMMIEDKHILLLRQKGDKTELPFNISHFHVYEYDLMSKKSELRIWDEAEDSFYPLSDLLLRFIDGLPSKVNSDFQSAKNWKAGK